MILFFNTFIAESKNPDEPTRLARLDWTVVGPQHTIVRGFQMNIDPISSEWQMTEDGAYIESGETFGRICIIGHPIEKVLARFIADHDLCQKVVTPDCERCFGILIDEAKRAGIRAATRINDRLSLSDYTDEYLDLKQNMRPIIDFFVKKDNNGFNEFVLPLQKNEA